MEKAAYNANYPQIPPQMASPGPGQMPSGPPSYDRAAGMGQPGFGAPPSTTQPPVIIIQQHAMLPLGPEPTFITCPVCHVQKLTRIEYEPGSRSHLMAGLLCILGLWCCVCLPYCVQSCMNANHYCGNCNRFLGTYND